MVDRPKMHYWAEGVKDKFSAAIDYNPRADGGIRYKGHIAVEGFPEWIQLTAKLMHGPLKAAGYEPEPIKGPPGGFTGTWRMLTQEEERQLLDALNGK